MYALIDEVLDNGELVFDANNGIIYGATKEFSKKIMGQIALFNDGEITSLFPKILDLINEPGE